MSGNRATTRLLKSLSNVNCVSTSDPDQAVYPELLKPKPRTTLDKRVKESGGQTFTDTNGDGKISAGDTMTFEFVLTNIGNMAITQATVKDPRIGATLTCPVSNTNPLAPGDEVTCGTRSYVLTEADIAAGSVNNTASLAAVAGPVTADAVTDTTSTNTGTTGGTTGTGGTTTGGGTTTTTTTTTGGGGTTTGGGGTHFDNGGTTILLPGGTTVGGTTINGGGGGTSWNIDPTVDGTNGANGPNGTSWNTAGTTRTSYDLARTGVPVGDEVWDAMLLLASGLVLVLGARRRRESNDQ